MEGTASVETSMWEKFQMKDSSVAETEGQMEDLVQHVVGWEAGTDLAGPDHLGMALGLQFPVMKSLGRISGRRKPW